MMSCPDPTPVPTSISTTTDQPTTLFSCDYYYCRFDSDYNSWIQYPYTCPMGTMFNQDTKRCAMAAMGGND